EPVLVPAVGAGTRVVVRKEFPGRAVFAVILTDRPPGPLTQVRPPQSPRLAALARLGQSLFLLGHISTASPAGSIRRRPNNACPSRPRLHRSPGRPRPKRPPRAGRNGPRGSR